MMLWYIKGKAKRHECEVVLCKARQRKSGCTPLLDCQHLQNRQSCNGQGFTRIHNYINCKHSVLIGARLSASPDQQVVSRKRGRMWTPVSDHGTMDRLYRGM